MSEQTTFPVSHQFTIGFNAYQDRLVLTTELSQHGLWAHYSIAYKTHGLTDITADHQSTA